MFSDDIISPLRVIDSYTGLGTICLFKSVHPSLSHAFM